MNQTAPDTARLLRWMYLLIIAIAFAIACGRIASVQRVYEPAFYTDPARWPKTKPDANSMFGSNDRARWATIRALVHDGTYVIGQRDLAAPDSIRTDVSNPKSHWGIIFKTGEKEHGWATIDRVMDPETGKFYSSKPPLLSTLLAALYWVLFHLFNLSMIDQPTTVVRIILTLINALPFAGYLWLLMQVAERWGKTEWGKLYVLAAGAFGTTVSPFLITLQNHTVGTFAVMLAWWSVLCMWDKVSSKETPAWPHFVSAGFFSGFAFTMEMPALSFTAAAFVLLVWWCPRQTLLLFVPAAIVPVIAFFATNYIAIGQVRPIQSQFSSAWYRYEGSHWNPPAPGQPRKKGIDWAKDHESRAEYVLHVLVGHHGLFSLTPIWLLAFVGMIVGCWHGRDLWRQAVFREQADFPWFVQPIGLAITVVVLGFYVMNDASRNYGGFTNGLRWLMWLTPLWLTCLIPMADRLASSKAGRWVGGVCLAISIFSVSYQLWSPWRHPWIFDFMVEFGWSAYQS